MYKRQELSVLRMKQNEMLRRNYRSFRWWVVSYIEHCRIKQGLHFCKQQQCLCSCMAPNDRWLQTTLYTKFKIQNVFSETTKGLYRTRSFAQWRLYELTTGIAYKRYNPEYRLKWSQHLDRMENRWLPKIPVSYTHLDVYKRQIWYPVLRYCWS